MRLFCFNKHQKNFNRHISFSHLSSSPLGNLPQGANAIEIYLPRSNDETSSVDAKVAHAETTEQTTEQTTKKAGTTSETLKSIQRPVTSKAKERLKVRTITDIFENKETQEYYIDNVKKALEKLSGDKLHGFIMAHKSYSISSHKAWNKDFADMLGFRPEEKYRGKDEPNTQRRISAAMQHVLVDFYNIDVFQITKKKINPWIFIDGKLGPYTVSVLSDYWTSKFDEDSDRESPGNSGLNTNSYKSGGDAEKSYIAALDYKNVQLGRPSTKEELKVEIEKKRSTTERSKWGYEKLDTAGDEYSIAKLETNFKNKTKKPMKLSEALGLAYKEAPIKSGKSLHTFRALNLIDRKIGNKIDEIKVNPGDIIKVSKNGEFTLEKADGTSETDDATSTAVEPVESVESVEPEKSVAQVGQEKPEEPEEAEEGVEPEESHLNRELKEKMISKFNEFINIKLISEFDMGLAKDIKADLLELKEDPSDSFNIVRGNDMTINISSDVSIAAEQYRLAYEAVEDSKDKKFEGYKALKIKRDNSWKALEREVNKYLYKINSIFYNSKIEYKNGLSMLINKYEIQNNIDLDKFTNDLEHTWGKYVPHKKDYNIPTITVEGKSPPSTEDIRKIKKLLGKIPTKTLQKPEDLNKYLKKKFGNISSDKKAGILDLAGGINGFNAMVYKENYKRFIDEHSKMISDINKNRVLQIEELNN